MTNKSPSPHGYIRAEDCRIAENYEGFRWFKLDKPKLDFNNREFTHILSRSGYLSHVLEPDTRVPNYTTNIIDAATLAFTHNIPTNDLIEELIKRVENKRVENKHPEDEVAAQ